MDFQREVFSAHLFATPETFRALASTLIAGPTSIVLVDERGPRLVGMLAAVIYQQPMSKELIGSELCWWVDPGARGGSAGLRLLRCAENWARAHGAVAFQMSAPTPEVCHFYERIDYTKVETLYQRRLCL